jgi:hypothetical protein
LAQSAKTDIDVKAADLARGIDEVERRIGAFRADLQFLGGVCGGNGKGGSAGKHQCNDLFSHALVPLVVHRLPVLDGNSMPEVDINEIDRGNSQYKFT